MEEDLAAEISRSYRGELVISDENDISGLSVDIKRINNITVLVTFKIRENETTFRAKLSRQKEGILFKVQEKFSQNYLLRGVSGFLSGKPNIHGGFLRQLNGFYFHINKTFFNRQEKEYYFLGQEDKQTQPIKPRMVYSQLSSF